MSYESVRKTVYGQFAALWDIETYPVVAENQPWPSGRAPAGAWGRYSVRPASNVTTDIEGASRRGTGLIWLQIFIPENKGVAMATKMADAMETLFGNKAFVTEDSVVRTERAEYGFVGSDSGGFSQHRVTVDYTEDSLTLGSTTVMATIIDLPNVTRKTGGNPATDLDAQSVAHYRIGQTVSVTIDDALQFFRLYSGSATEAHHVATPTANRHWRKTGGIL